MAAADAAASAAADTDALMGGGRSVPITPSKLRSEIVSAPSSPDARVLETVHEVPSIGATSVAQTPTNFALLEPVGFISPPTADAPDEEVVVVAAVTSVTKGGGDFVVDAAEEDMDAASTAATAVAGAPAGGASTSLLASFEAAAAVPAPAPTIAGAGGPSCATCKTATAERKAAISAGVWAPVCGPCGDALDAGKPPLGNLLESVVHASLKTVFVTEEEEGTEASK